MERLSGCLGVYLVIVFTSAIDELNTHTGS